MNADNDIPASQQTDQPARPSRRRLTRWFDTALLLAVIALPLLALGLRAKAEVIGFAEVNLLTSLFVILLLLAILFRVALFRQWSRSTRWTVLAIVALAFIGSVCVLRIDRVSGRLVPVLRWVWVKKPDQLLALPRLSTSEQAVDLTTTTAEDSPQFLGPQRNLHAPDVRLVSDWDCDPPRELWRRSIGAGWSGFSAVNGFAVTMEQRGEDELVTCYEIETGEMRWSHGFETRHETVMGGTGPRCTPTIDAGRVFTQGATGIVCCLDGNSGELLWSDNILERYGVTPDEDLKAVAWGRSASPLVVDELLVVPFGGPAGGPYHSLIAYEKQSGKIRWRGGDCQVSYSSPAIAELGGVRQIVSVNENSVTGHRPNDGTVLWSHPWKGQSNAGASVSQPVPLPGDCLLLTKAYGQGAQLLRITVDSRGEFAAQSLWSNRRLLKTKFTNVAVIDRFAYGLSDGILECVEWQTGERQWKDRRRGNFGHGQILVVGGLLLVQSEAGDVVLIEPDPRELRELGRFSALSDQCWNNLCLYGKYLLVRNGVEAACFELPVKMLPESVSSQQSLDSATLR